MMTVQTATISETTFEPNIQAISVLESTTNVALMPETDGRVVQVLSLGVVPPFYVVIKGLESRWFRQKQQDGSDNASIAGAG